MSAAAFIEKRVEADGFSIRYLEAGEGSPLVYLHGAGGLRISHAHELLSRRFRVLAFELPGFGSSPENTRTASIPELGLTVARALANLGVDTFDLMGTSFGAITALWLAIQAPERVSGLVLESPAALRPEGYVRPALSPEQRSTLLYAHPERAAGLLSPPDPSVVEQQERLVQRLLGPNHDSVLETRMREMDIPTLALFGTRDAVLPPAMGRRYREIMPDCYYVLVYNAGHAIGVDRPEAFANVVADFLERHEAFVVSNESEKLQP